MFDIFRGRVVSRASIQRAGIMLGCRSDDVAGRGSDGSNSIFGVLIRVNLSKSLA